MNTEGLLCSRGHRESDQGTARWAADRPHELLSVLGEPVARLPDRRGLRAHAGTAIAGGAYCVCPQPGDVAARPAAEAGGPRRALGPPRGSASAALDAAPRGVAAHRARPGRARRIAHPLRRAHLLPGRQGPLRRRGCRCPTLASLMPPGRLLKPRLRLQAAMSETHSCADHALSAVESGPSRIMQAKGRRKNRFRFHHMGSMV